MRRADRNTLSVLHAGTRMEEDFMVMRIPFLDTWHTYDDDIPLLKELGLPHSYGGDCWQEVFIGEVKRDEDGWVKIWCSGAPAQFFRFQGVSVEGRPFCFSTGSGTFSTYWPVIEMFLDGMIGSVNEETKK